MPNTPDPRKEGEALHKTITEVAQAVSDAFYKVDKAMLGLPPGSNMFGPLKTIRDTMFATKVQAEKMVTQATTELQAIPVVPEEPMASKTGAAVPTVQAETIWDALSQGKPGKAGNLSTDGTVVSLHGNPIFKIEDNKVFVSWGNHQPSPTTLTNVNGLALLAGFPTKPFSIQGGQAFCMGEPVADLGAWQALGPMPGHATPVAASAKPPVPDLLRPRRR